MAWLAVDKNGDELIFASEPRRDTDNDLWDSSDLSDEGNYVDLPIGTIEKLLGQVLTWDDEPVNLYDKIEFNQKEGKK